MPKKPDSPKSAPAPAPAPGRKKTFVERSADAKATSDPQLKGKIPDDILDSYEVREWKHAAAILATDFPNEFKDLVAILRGFKFKRSQIVAGGGGKTGMAQDLDAAFEKHGWIEKRWDTKIVVDDQTKESPTHASPRELVGSAAGFIGRQPLAVEQRARRREIWSPFATRSTSYAEVTYAEKT